MRFDVVTLFAPMLELLTTQGITRRAHDEGRWQLVNWNPRQFTTDVHKTVDDRPFGGGPGMVMMAEPLAQAVTAAQAAQRAAGIDRSPVIALSPAGVPLTDARVRSLARTERGVVLVCGRYEGIDQRFLDQLVDEEVSIGDFVLSGGEIAAMALIDAVVRQLPGALKDASVADESFADGLLAGPVYTRPEVWRGASVPAPLLSGHHAQIAAWHRAQALRWTLERRPELIAQLRSAGGLTAADEAHLRAPSNASGREEQHGAASSTRSTGKDKPEAA